jgi:plastocyanin
MKIKVLLFFAAVASVFVAKATNYNINISGTTYTPASLTVEINDVVTIEANSTHPLVQVSASTWASMTNTPLGGGWGTKTANHEITITNTDTIFFVCQNHAGDGMRGIIVVDEVNKTRKVAQQPLHIVNPVSNGVLVVHNSNTNSIDLSIFDLSGRLVQTAVLPSGSSNIALANKGTYVLVLQNKETALLRKEVLISE